MKPTTLLKRNLSQWLFNCIVTVSLRIPCKARQYPLLQFQDHKSLFRHKNLFKSASIASRNDHFTFFFAPIFNKKLFFHWKQKFWNIQRTQIIKTYSILQCILFLHIVTFNLHRWCLLHLHKSKNEKRTINNCSVNIYKDKWKKITIQ